MLDLAEVKVYQIQANKIPIMSESHKDLSTLLSILGFGDFTPVWYGQFYLSMVWRIAVDQ